MESVASTPASRLLEWGVSVKALAGESECGDACAVVPHAAGILVAVVDGMGHGAEAAAASRAAVAMLERHPHEPLAQLLTRCHEGIRKTRGAVLSLASFQAGANTMTWAAIGNVEGMLFRADRTAKPVRETLVPRGGTVGYNMPVPRVTTVRVFRGDMLVFATDGIAGNFGDLSLVGQEPQAAADLILRRCAKRSDDALVLVARYQGGSP
jgi:serine/threonine protein phosphatase PrpC